MKGALNQNSHIRESNYWFKTEISDGYVVNHRLINRQSTTSQVAISQLQFRVCNVFHCSDAVHMFSSWRDYNQPTTKNLT
jgi:hypothetical protein